MTILHLIFPRRTIDCRIFFKGKDREEDWKEDQEARATSRFKFQVSMEENDETQALMQEERPNPGSRD